MVSRAVLFSIDDKERRISLWAAGLEALLSLFILGTVLFDFKKTTTFTEKIPKTGSCPSPYTKNGAGTLCQYVQTNTRGGSYLLFGLIVLCTVALLMFTRRRSRPGTVFVLVFTGLAFAQLSFLFGLPFLAAGFWILYRGWCLHKYGVVGFAAVNQVKQDRLAARREGRDDPHPPPPPEPVAPRQRRPPRARREDAESQSAPAAPRRPTEPSKRYTPKKKPRTRSR